MYDGSKVNEALYEAINPVTNKVNVSPSPVLKMQSVKNETELAGERIAMRKDAVALTRFFHWLENHAFSLSPLASSPQTEITLAQKLGEFRAMGENYTDDSFCTIAGWKGNGAIVHYHATPEECATIEGEGVLLLDSGGQYLDGTTDITRTVWIGNPAHIPAAVKRDQSFIDVAEQDFYYEAMLWALEKEIAEPLADGVFAPYSVCSRSQVVEFLYKAYQ